MQRAVAELGFCDPPTLQTGRHSMPGQRWSTGLGAVGRPVARHVHADPRGSVAASAANLLKVGRWLAAEHTRGRRPGGLDAADLRDLDRRAGPDAGR